MKVTKEVVPNQAEKRSKLLGIFGKKDEEAKVPKYDGSVKYLLTKYEYELISDLSRRIGYDGSSKQFVKESVEKHNELTNLILPAVEDQAPFHWLTFEFEKEQKESLKAAAKEARISLEEYVRAVVWTNYKTLEQKKKERDQRLEELRRKQQGTQVRFVLNDELLERYEDRFGPAVDQEAVTGNIKSLLIAALKK